MAFGTQRYRLLYKKNIMKYKPEKINILFVMMYVQMGGIERLVYNLSRNLDTTIFNPSIAWFVGDEVCKEFVDLNIPLFYVPKEKRVDFSTMRQLENIIKENNIHIVNAHGFLNMVYSFYGCKIKNQRKLVYTVHSGWEIQQTSWKWRIVGRFLVKFIDSLICVNHSFLKSLEKTFKVNPSKNIAIPNGVVLSNLYNKETCQFLKTKLNILPNDIVIGNIANLKKVKNHIMLLKGFNNIVKNHNHVKLLVIGQGFENDSENTEKEIVNFIKENGLQNNVLLLGYRSDISELLNIMDIFCLTSVKEGLPLSLIEAMAAGLPLVGTNVEGIRDVIIHNENGFLIDLNDIKGLEKAIHVLLTDETLRRKFGYESKKNAKNKYSLSHCIDSYQNLFLFLMNK
ncbi:MAG: glycosyltransferase family 4 protein [Candidatus Heimdallarchaeota archaeon]